MSGHIRPFEVDDAPRVADLFWRILYRKKGSAPVSLVDYFVTIYCRHPWADPDIRSLVYLQNGEPRGFIGVLPAPFMHGERPIRAAICGSLMVDGSAQDPLAGARLLRTFLAGRQDISLTETANSISVGMFRAIGGRVVVNRSLEWVRVFRPFTLATAFAADRLAPIGLALPFAVALDQLIERRLPAPDAPACKGEEIAPNELSALVRRVSDRFRLRPAFDETALQFLLEHAAVKEAFGAPLARLLRDRRGEPIGGYLAHGRRRGILEVLQVFALPGHADLVIDDLMAQAASRGQAGVCGRVQPELMPSLVVKASFFRKSGVTLAASRDRELLAAACGDDNFFNGLAGESWARIIGGAFGDRDNARERAPLRGLDAPAASGP